MSGLTFHEHRDWVSQRIADVSWRATPSGCGALVNISILSKQVVAPLPAGLEAAREHAFMAYIRSESGSSNVRTCDSNSLCTFWSGADQFEAERVPPVHHHQMLSATEIASCHAAAEASGARGDDVDMTADVCKALAGEFYHVVYSAEHVACYLHRDGLFASRCPALHAKLVAAAAAAPPGLSSPRVPLHVRCLELHAYAAGGALLDAGHKDNGSKRTLVVQLSDEASFEGGKFVTWTEGEAVLNELGAGDGLLLNSEKMHNVSPVTSGIRRSLVMELWVAPANQRDRFS